MTLPHGTEYEVPKLVNRRPPIVFPGGSRLSFCPWIWTFPPIRTPAQRLPPRRFVSASSPVLRRKATAATLAHLNYPLVRSSAPPCTLHSVLMDSTATYTYTYTAEVEQPVDQDQSSGGPNYCVIA
ncbi:hypothetical protein FRC07_006638, partial [Ceratobasidium sp. 392]